MFKVTTTTTSCDERTRTRVKLS